MAGAIERRRLTGALVLILLFVGVIPVLLVLAATTEPAPTWLGIAAATWLLVVRLVLAVLWRRVGPD